MRDMRLYREKLLLDLELLDKSVDVLKYSFEKCKNIGIKENYSMEELESYESLSGRYARSSDILTQKIIKNMFIIMQEDTKTFIDRCNLCEKLDIVDVETLYNIRKLRNDISHEYCIVDITELFADLLENSEKLFVIIDSVKRFIENNRITVL